jgi:hypothetical protein
LERIMPTNAERADRAADILDAYVREIGEVWSGDEVEQIELIRSFITDLLTDIRHLCDKLGIDWAGVSRLADIHHAEELKDD